VHTARYCISIVWTSSNFAIKLISSLIQFSRKLLLVGNHWRRETGDTRDTPVRAQNSRCYRRERYRCAYLPRAAAVVRVVPICRIFIGRHLMAIRHRRSAEWRTSLPRSDTRVQWEQSGVRVLGRCFVSFRRWTSRVICHAF